MDASSSDVNNLAGDLFMPGLSGVCSVCGPILLMDTYYQCRRKVHTYCEFCFNITLNLTGCEMCRKDPNYKRHADSPDMDSCFNKSKGCTYVKINNDEDAYWQHVACCKFQMLRCPLDQAECDWGGEFEDLLGHFQENHPENYKPTGSFQVTLPFSIDKEESFLNLISYKGELFYYRHRLVLEDEKFYVCVMLLSTEEQAKRYSYQYEIKDLSSSKSLNMVELCHSFALGDSYIKEAQKCIVIPLKTLRRYVTTGELKIELNITKVA